MLNKELVVNFPEKLRQLPRWVLWKKELIPVKEGSEEKKLTKVPYQTNGKKAAVSRPNEWTTFDNVLAKADDYDGIGFVFTEGLVGIDLDKCFEYDGTLKEFAQDALLELNSYTEKSPSGNGLHIIIESDVPLAGRKANAIECYSTGRFFTVTGNVFNGRDTLRDCDVSGWYKNTFPARNNTPVIPIQGETGYLPEDRKILAVMFKSKGGQKLKNLYVNGAWADEGYGSQSEADLALVGSLMFYCRNNFITVDRLFRKSKLMRPKWDEVHGAGTYGQNTMSYAIKNPVMDWKQPEDEEPEFIMSGDKDPKPMLILENISRVMAREDELKSRFRLNDFSHMVEVFNGRDWKNMQDQDVLDTQRWISINFPCFARVSKELVTDAIKCTAAMNKVNPPVDYLKSLTWDKIPRLDYWLHLVYGTPNDEMHEKIGANWMKGLVKRVLHPGCQFDEVLVLEGEQGWRKSTSLRVLGAPWHVESTLSMDDRDFYMLLAQNMIVEFSEGDIVGRTSARKLKAIITKVEDSYRPPYEHGLLTFKRGCVFAMTTNDSDYQKDETGGRRWLPVVLGKVADIDWLTQNRDQLYAEAVYRVETLHETTHEYPQAELQALQSEKFEYDEIAEPIVEWYSNLTQRQRDEGVLTIDAYNGALNTDKGSLDGDKREIPQAMTWRIGKVYRATLGLVKVNKRVGDKMIKRWIKKD